MLPVIPIRKTNLGFALNGHTNWRYKMSTPGRRRALKKLAARKRANKRAYARGAKKASIGGKRVSFKTFFKKIGGKPKSWKKRRRKK